MSNPGKSNPFTTLVVTGNPTADALIRYALVAVFAASTGVIMTWLNAHGFHDPNLSLMISGAISSTLGGIALALWGIVKASKNETIMKLREAIGVQAGIAAAEAPSPTPTIATVADAQKVIADHAPETIPPVK